jgi:lipoprotein-releasing system permease protein
MNPLERFIAFRYMLSRSRIRFINVIGLVSIVGITIGVAALLIALSVFNGFNGVVTDVLVGFDPHVRIEKKGGLGSSEAAAIQTILDGDARISAYAPFVSGKAMLVARSFNRVVLIRGVDENRIAGVSGLKERLVLGSLSLPDSGHEIGIIIGLTLADRLGSVVGDQITLISPYGFQAGLSSLMTPPTINCRIMGIYESNNKDYDANYAYISLHAAQEAFHS